MQRAYGTVNCLEREDALVFEAIYQPSYRYAARRLPGTLAPQGLLWAHENEGEAIRALERAAEVDGTSLTIQAGTYPRGTRRRDEVIAQTNRASP
jgi:hypothetical protein